MEFRGSIICLCILISLICVSGQEKSSEARKFDEIGRMIADSEMTRLDDFALELSKNPNSSGYIIGYDIPSEFSGYFLRKIYGYQEYLVNKRGVNPDLIKIVIGESETKQPTELWIVPKSTSQLPKPSRLLQFSLKKPVKFDEVLMGVGCEPEFTIDLYELKDGLKIYADVLRQNPSSQLSIIVYPNRRNRLSKAAQVASQTKKLLIKNFNIEANRIKAKAINKRRECMTAEIWITPNASKKGNT